MWTKPFFEHLRQLFLDNTQYHISCLSTTRSAAEALHCEGLTTVMPANKPDKPGVTSTKAIGHLQPCPSPQEVQAPLGAWIGEHTSSLLCTL